MKASKKTKSHSSPAAVKRETYKLPSHDALAQILPKCQSPQTGAKPGCWIAAQQEQQTPAERAEATEGNKPNINRTYQVRQPHKRLPLYGFGDDPHIAEIADLQTKEVDNYRSAMSRMADDIITLRTQVVLLEAENSQLRTDLTLHQGLGQNLLDDTNIDVMTKAKIANRIATLKFKHANEANKETVQRDRIQKLQNELIRKNDMEKELITLQRVHRQQQEALQRQHRHLTKMATLEVTVKQQEQIIEKMEKALNHTLKETNKQGGNKKLQKKVQRDEADCKKVEVESALVAENSRLRKELDRIHDAAPVVIQQSAQTEDRLSAHERLSLISKLEKAEAKIKMLEGQLEENAKLWGRQKQEMLIKLNEQRHGFVRTSTTILHNVNQLEGFFND